MHKVGETDPTPASHISSSIHWVQVTQCTNEQELESQYVHTCGCMCCPCIPMETKEDLKTPMTFSFLTQGLSLAWSSLEAKLAGLEAQGSVCLLLPSTGLCTTRHTGHSQGAKYQALLAELSSRSWELQSLIDQSQRKAEGPGITR